MNLEYMKAASFTLTAFTACFILYTRSAGVIYFATGAAFCGLTVQVVKRTIRQPRPPNRRKLKVSYGCVEARAVIHLGVITHILPTSMPSTHSAAVSYCAVYIFLGCLYLPIHPTLPSGLYTRILPPLISFPCVITVFMSRMWLGHHTMPQVVAGISYGVTFASMWFALWTRGLNSWGGHAEQNFNDWIMTQCW